MMLCFAVICLLAIYETHSQPVMPCLKDFHCPVDWFCETSVHVCHKCVDCREVNRSPPASAQRLKTSTCLKTAWNCGPCLQGWTLDKSYFLSPKCVPAEAKSVYFLYKYMLWLTAACTAAGILITVLFLRVLRSTNIYETVSM